MWSNRNSHSLLVGMQNGTPTLEGSLADSFKSNIPLLNDSTVPHTYPNDLETHGHTKPAQESLKQVWFMIAKTWKQLRWPSIGEWINKLWWLQTMKKRGRRPWNDMEELYSILISERSQSEKVTYCIIPIVWHRGKGKQWRQLKNKN